MPFYDDVVKTIKTILLAVILLSMFKIYENGGYQNPITIAVIIIMFSLWILFRIELNEEVTQEINCNEENNYKQNNTNSICGSQQSSTCTSPLRSLKKMPLALSMNDKSNRVEKRKTKLRALVKSRSKSPDLNK